jgi:hypothetical protein
VTAWSEARRSGGGFLAAVAARAERWLLEPASPKPRATDPEPYTRAVIAVVALGPRCGTTTVARALAAELARRDHSGTAIVTSESRGATAALATAPARRLARALPEHAASATGRLCLLDPDAAALRALAGSRPAPLVLDVRHGDPPESAVALADATVLVASPAVEPALADVVAATLARADATPPVVLNRAVELDAWSGRRPITIGDARLGARLALAGRDTTPGLARPIADLVDLLIGEEPS